MSAPAILTARNATLADMVAILRDQRARTLDVVAPAAAIHAHGGNLIISGTVQYLSADGVTCAAGIYRPTKVADEGIADKLGIALPYLRRLRDQRPDLWDANVNGWLHGNDLADIPPDGRRFLVRLFQAGGDNPGVARALLSDSYKRIDNLDALMATLDGIRQAGVDVEFDGLDLTERRLYARVVAPQVRAWAPRLLAGYRSPFGGATYTPGRARSPEQARQAAREHQGFYQPGTEPVLFAGFVVSNSEVGEGAWSITPRIVALACGNGLQITADIARAVHLGARHDEGVIRFSADTADKELALITARARDAVATFLSEDYLRGKAADLERTAGVPVSHPEETIRQVAKTAGSATSWPTRSWRTSSAAGSSPPAGSCRRSRASPRPWMTPTLPPAWRPRR